MQKILNLAKSSYVILPIYVCIQLGSWCFSIFHVSHASCPRDGNIGLSVSRSTTLLQTEISQHLWDRLPWILVQTFRFPRGWSHQFWLSLDFFSSYTNMSWAYLIFLLKHINYPLYPMLYIERHRHVRIWTNDIPMSLSCTFCLVLIRKC